MTWTDEQDEKIGDAITAAEKAIGLLSGHSPELKQVTLATEELLWAGSLLQEVVE